MIKTYLHIPVLWAQYTPIYTYYPALHLSSKVIALTAQGGDRMKSFLSLVWVQVINKFICQFCIYSLTFS